MKVLVNYRDFLWDNYQGGSGVYIESHLIFEVPGSLVASDIVGWIRKKLDAFVLDGDRPFKQANDIVITKIEILKCVL